MPPAYSEFSDHDTEDQTSDPLEEFLVRESPEARSSARKRRHQPGQEGLGPTKRRKWVPEDDRSLNKLPPAVVKNISPSRVYTQSPTVKSRPHGSSKSILTNKRKGSFKPIDNLSSPARTAACTLLSTQGRVQRSSINIDPEDDIIDDDVSVRARGKPTRSPSAVSCRRTQSPGFFSPSEIRNVSSTLGQGPSRHKHGHRSRSPTNLDSNHRQSVQDLLLQHKRSSEGLAIRSKSSRLPINLLDRVEESSADDNLALTRESDGPLRKEMKWSQMTVENTRRPLHDKATAHEDSSRRAIALTKTFLRDDGQVSTRKPIPRSEPQSASDLRRASQRMQSESKTDRNRQSKPSNETDDSGDELSGQATVRSDPKCSVFSSGTRFSKLREPSPSDLQCTKFCRSSSPPTASLSISSTIFGAGPKSFSVAEFNSSHFVLPEAVPACFIWDGGQGDFELHTSEAFDGPVPPGEQARLRLKSGRKTLICCDGDSRIIVKGSISADCPGATCFRLYNTTEVQAFLKQCATHKQNIKVEVIGEEDMSKRYERLSKDNVQAFARKVRHEPEQIGVSPPRAIDSDDENVSSTDHIAAKTAELSIGEKPLRRSTRPQRLSLRSGNIHRTPSPKLERWSVLHKPEPWSQPIIYPTTGTNRITVNFEDLERLDDGEFLNDNLLSYGFRKLEDDMPSKDRSHTHFFNSFFYSSLIPKKGKKDVNYDAVKRWTKSIDLFSFPFIVLPINTDLHWYLAIIYNLPRLTQGTKDELPCSPGVHSTPVVGDDDGQGQGDSRYLEDNDIHEAADSDALLIDGCQPTQVVVPDNVEQDQDATKIDEEVLPVPSRTTQRKKNRSLVRRPLEDSCVIMVLDSLGLDRSTQIRHIKQYIIREAKDKRGIKAEIGLLRGVNVKCIPLQENFSDCGIYLLEFLSRFAKDPHGFVQKAFRNQLDVERDFAGFGPSARRAELRSQLLTIYDEQERGRLMRKRERRAQAQAQHAAEAA